MSSRVESADRILVAVSEATGLDAVARVLSQAGYQVVQAATGHEALRAARDHRVDLVLLDAALPDMPAGEVARTMKVDPILGSPILVVLGSFHSGSSPQGLRPDEEAEDVIPRPVASRDLLARVRMHLRQRELVAQLRACEARFCERIQARRDAVIVVDEEGGVLFSNAAAERLLGRRSLALARQQFEFPIEDGSEIEIRSPEPDVRSVHAEMRVERMQWEGQAARMVTLRDVSEERRLKEDLRKQTALLSNAQRIGRMGIWIMDLRSRRLMWSDVTCELFGIAPAEFAGTVEHFYSFLLPEDRLALDAAHARSLAANGRIEAEYRIRRPDGEVRWMYECGDVECDISGVPVRRLGMVMDITERKRSEEERQKLLEREQAARAEADAASHYYRSLFESAPGCYVVLTPDDFTIVAVSDAYLNATMTRRQRISGRCIFDVFPDDPSDPDANGVRNLRASLASVKAERRSNVMAVQRHPIRRPDEEGGAFEERFWSPVNCPVFGPDGRLAYIIHRVEDVTEYMQLKRSQNRGDDAMAALETRAAQIEADIVLRNLELKRANEQLAQSQALLKMASHLGQIGGWTLDLPEYRLIWSDEVCAIHDVRRDDVPTLDEAIDFYVPECRETIRQALEKCAREGIPYDLELQILTRKGERVWVRAMGQAVRDDFGRIIRIQGALQDTSQRKRAEQSIRESEARFRLLSQATNDAIWDWNLVTNTLWWSEGFETLFGFRRDEEELSIESWTNRIHPDDRDRVIAEVRRAIAGDIDRWTGRYRFLRQDGAYVHVFDRGHVIRDASGTAVRMVGGMTDISERLELVEQLRQSQRLEAIGQLTGGVAHDFNNLITVILGSADQLKEQLANDPHSRTLAEMAARAARRGADLTQRLLAFARKQTLDPRAVDVNQLVSTMDGLLRRTLGEHIEIEVVRGANLSPAMVDSGQLENALLNLALNARDAMPNGGRLKIETANVRLDPPYAGQIGDIAPGDYVLLAVSDTGEGIAPEHLGHVFEPFFTTKEKGKGTGLGLAMIYGFLKQSGGHVYIASKPGQGARVEMYLPRVKETIMEPGIPEGDRSVVGGGETILLVEDDDLVRQYAEDLLTTLGYRVIRAENSHEALKVLREDTRVDLLFTDLVMPGGMSGKQLVDEARKLRPTLKALYTSGYADDIIAQHGQLEVGVRLLSKPYRQAELANAIRQALADDPALRNEKWP